MGWALAMQGQGEEGMAQVRQGIATRPATGAAVLGPYFCTLLAEVSARLGHTEDGIQALAEAHTLVEQQEERWWEAEVCRLRGVLLLRQPGTPQAEAEPSFPASPGRRPPPGGKTLKLRAAMSLALLWQQQGRHTEARDLLAPIYDWFTEGFDTADLQEAKALLEALGDNTGAHNTPLKHLAQFCSAMMVESMTGGQRLWAMFCAATSAQDQRTACK